MPRSKLFQQLFGGLALLALASQLQAADLRPKKLIEFGWDEPDLAFIRAHLPEMQRTPFDGCVFHVDYKRADGKTGSFTWQSWGQQAFTETDLRDAFADLETIHFGRFNSTFLRFNTTPAT